MALPPRWYVLKLPRMSYRIGRRGLTLWLVLAILFAQGLRLCLHALHAADEVHAHAAAIHLESNIASPLDSDDDANDSHVPLGLALIKQLTDSTAFAALLAVMLLPFSPTAKTRFAVSRDAIPVPAVDRRLRPPLRAPPH